MKDFPIAIDAIIKNEPYTSAGIKSSEWNSPSNIDKNVPIKVNGGAK